MDVKILDWKSVTQIYRQFLNRTRNDTNNVINSILLFPYNIIRNIIIIIYNRITTYRRFLYN